MPEFLNVNYIFNNDFFIPCSFFALINGYQFCKSEF